MIGIHGKGRSEEKRKSREEKEIKTGKNDEIVSE